MSHYCLFVLLQNLMRKALQTFSVGKDDFEFSEWRWSTFTMECLMGTTFKRWFFSWFYSPQAHFSQSEDNLQQILGIKDSKTARGCPLARRRNTVVSAAGLTTILFFFCLTMQYCLNITPVKTCYVVVLPEWGTLHNFSCVTKILNNMKTWPQGHFL